MTFYKFTGATDARATEVNENLGLLASQQIISRLNHEKTGTSGIVTGNGFVYDFVEDATDTSYADTAGTTCYYDEVGNVALCEQLDLFDDASIDTNIWATSGTASESGGSLTISQTGSGTSTAIANQVNGINVEGANSEFFCAFNIVFTDNNAPTSDPSAEVHARVQLSDGTTHIDLYDFSDTGADGFSANVTQYVHLVYDDATETVDVYVDGTLDTAGIDVSSITNKYIRFQTDGTASGGDSATSTFNIYAVGYIKQGVSSGGVVFESASQTIDYSSSSGSVWAELTPVQRSDMSATLSFDGGSTYGSDDVWKKLGAGGTAGTSFQIKFSFTLPSTLDVTAKNISLLTKWGAIYD